MDKILSVCWNLTSRCNQSCEFCFRDTTEKELPLLENMDILKKLINYGIKKISFTGGEVTLYKGLWKLAEYAHTHGVYTNVITNGSTITDSLYELLPNYIDCLTLPLDTLDINMQKAMGRGAHHSDQILKILYEIKRKGINIDLKINTVATKYNIKEIQYLYPILREFDVKFWKIFQFTPLRFRAKDNDNKFHLDNGDFERIKAILCEQIEEFDNPLKLTFQASDEIVDSYAVILSDGTISGTDNIPEATRNLRCHDLETLIKYMNFNFCNYYKRHPINGIV